MRGFHPEKECVVMTIRLFCVVFYVCECAYLFSVTAITKSLAQRYFLESRTRIPYSSIWVFEHTGIMFVIACTILALIYILAGSTKEPSRWWQYFATTTYIGVLYTALHIYAFALAVVPLHAGHL